LFAMGENGQLPRLLCATHPRLRTPVPAILVTAAITLALALSTTFISALTISTVVRLLAYTSTCAALPVLRRDPRSPRPSFVAPAGPLVSVVAVTFSVWLLSNSPASEMRVAGLAVLLGLVVYAIFGRGSRAPQAAPAASGQ